jgi:hypothetical protein
VVLNKPWNKIAINYEFAIDSLVHPKCLDTYKELDTVSNEIALKCLIDSKSETTMMQLITENKLAIIDAEYSKDILRLSPYF